MAGVFWVGVLCSHSAPGWPYFTPLRKQPSEWQIDRCMGGYQKRSCFISCLSCKVKSIFFFNFMKMSSSWDLKTCPLVSREDWQIPQVKSCNVRDSFEPLSNELGCGPQPGFSRGEGRLPRASWAPKDVAKPHPGAWNDAPPFYFNTSKEHKHQEIHAHESSCVGNFAFLIEEEIENIPLFFFFYSKKMKRSWCWERLGAGGEVDNRGWDG